MHAKLHTIKPMLICVDVPRSIDFYTHVLGFSVVDRMDDVGRSGWASLERDGVGIMLASPSYLPRAPKVDGRFPQAIHYIHCSDATSLHRTARERGAEVSELRVTFYRMKEFDLVDPEGHQLCFGQDTDEPVPPSPHGKKPAT